MIAKIDCIPCILDDARGAIDFLTSDEDLKRRIMKECLQFLAENCDLKKEPSIYITEIHRIIKKITNIRLPFAERRKLCNQLGLELEKRIQTDSIQDSFEKFSELVRWSIAGNTLDFRTVGTGYDFNIDEVEKELISLVNNLDVDQILQIYENVKIAKRILFIHDNVGEIAIDKLLIKAIKLLENIKIISVVRGGAITSDATIDDAKQVNLDEVADSIIIAGPDTLGISFYEMSNDLKDEIAKADLIITKGQANFYVFSEHKDRINCPVVCLLRTKCHIVSSLFNFNKNINIATILT